MTYGKILSARLVALALFSIALILLAGCGGEQSSQDTSKEDTGQSTSGSETPGAGQSGQKYPDVVETELEQSEGETWSLSVTISSPYDSPERYADGWRVLSPDGTVLGKRKLTHPHSQQPFTRSLSGLEIPQDIKEITIEGRDLKNGYGGDTVTVPVER